jgi:solute:Na+ symporter, SSS family
VVSLHPLDWGILGLYLLFALAVGFRVRERAGTGRRSYFLADRSLPWWWAGVSVAATTFAADTPLAVTGIIAGRGLSGNWIWLSWVAVHAGVAVLFARLWWRSGVVTEAEVIGLRYSGRAAGWLRSSRAALFGLVYNAIILGWVLRAMGKILHPYVDWSAWTPGLVAALEPLWPAGAAVGGPDEGITILLLVGIVTLYSTLGGIRGVVFTDLVQFALGLLGSLWLGVAAWRAVGGRQGLGEGLAELYGEEHGYLDLFPTAGGGWLGALEVGALAFGAYLLVQSYANVPSDGGGYLQQRLNSCRSEDDASRAALLFVGLHYLVRVWPWFAVGLAALVLVPLGGEVEALGAPGAQVASDRELAYPVLMGFLLPAGAVGLLLTSLMAAFMSTIDTHLNWGASYVVNDVYLRVRPHATPREQVRVARWSVFGFGVLAVAVSLRIDTIEQAWTWVAFLGASLGVPTALRWIWWRVGPWAELGAMATGLSAGVLVVTLSPWPYEIQLLVTGAAAVAGMGVGIGMAPSPDPSATAAFQEQLDPPGFWPGRSRGAALRQLLWKAAGLAGIVLAVVAALWLGVALLFGR